MADRAWLEVRVFPWRPRPRVMRASTLRERVSDVDLLSGVDDLTGVVIALGVWIAILIAAPLIVLVLAGMLFSIELPVIIIIAAALALARFSGAIPWTVVETDPGNGNQARRSTRNFLKALKWIRDVNQSRHVAVHWTWY
jgi:hypothetical protein